MSDVIVQILRQTAESDPFRYIVERRHLTEAADEIERLRKLNSDYKQQIHVLRQRCESLVREAEGLRAERSATPVVRHFDGINQEPQGD